MTFLTKLEASIEKNNSLLCIGLDPDIDKLPKHLLNDPDPLFSFNKAIIDSTHDLVCVYKPQSAHYEKLGPKGMQSLENTIQYLQQNYPHIPVVFDAKRGDIGSTAEEYAKAAFDYYKFDAITVNPFMGRDALEPFLIRAEKGVIILCRTSNPSSSDFQDLLVNGKPLYVQIASKIIEWHNTYHNCLMVIGATYPNELKVIRSMTPDIFFLVPGIGAQGGDLEKTLEYGLMKNKSGLIIHSSRAILYASAGDDFADAAKEEATKLRDNINSFRS